MPDNLIVHNTMSPLENFYQKLKADIEDLAIQTDSSSEQAFTSIVAELLEDAGHIDSPNIKYDARLESGSRNQHKINGFSIEDNYESINLFVSVYQQEENLFSISKEDIDKAAKLIINFFKKAFFNAYIQMMDESSELYDFADTLANYQECRDNLVRINMLIFTNGLYSGQVPENINIENITAYFKIIDINSIFGLDRKIGIPIEINFDVEKDKVLCLKAVDEENFEAFVAVVPGSIISNLYKEHGARLMEQNVRSFLQFNGKINKGIRKTILENPEMFFSYNNGIAATAESISFDESGLYIKNINNLQIVNGGQTTASLFYTQRKNSEVDLSKIFVQMKISVIKNSEQYPSIVSNISRYANTQNKVNDADFSANNESLIELEKISNNTITPINAQNSQSYWFFERARGQYKTKRQNEGNTPSRQKQFDIRYPKNQVFTKVELAKYINSYKEVYSAKKLGKQLLIGPHIVVRGNEKNYTMFINKNLPEKDEINNSYFENVVAKAILFKNAELRYGTKKSENNIGEMRQVAVPYAIALLYNITQGHLDLKKIWKQQSVSQNLSDFLYKLMKSVNDFIIQHSPVTHYIEWAKKEECWNAVRSNDWNLNLDNIQDDLCSETDIEDKDDFSQQEDSMRKEVSSIKPETWKNILQYLRDTKCMTPNDVCRANYMIKQSSYWPEKKLSRKTLFEAKKILNYLQEKAPDILN